MVSDNLIIEETKSFDWKSFYFSFQGRINRKKYWMNFFLPVILVYFLLGITV